MDDKELKKFEKYEQFQKKDREASRKAHAIRHPIKLSHFKAHEYKQYALQKQHRKDIEYGPEMTPEEGWQTINKLISNWTPLQKILAICAIVFFCYIVICSFFAI